MKLSAHHIQCRSASNHNALRRDTGKETPFFNATAGHGFFRPATHLQCKCEQCEAEDKNLQRLPVQTKLTIGQPGDKYEQEADAMANRVVSSPQTALSGPVIQRKCAECEQEEKVQRSQEEEEEVHRKAEGTGNQGSAVLSSQLGSSKGNGNALPRHTKAQMETSFGADFSSVTIHTDDKAIQMNRQLHAQAFTHGSDIYFNKGKYDPDSSAGKHLLAHELTHTLQQGGTIQRQIEPEASVTTGFFDKKKEEDEGFLPGYTQCDFLDERISFEAQFALYHLYKRGGTDRHTAISILGAVKNNQMQGIYKEDQGKPALMARRHGTFWWQLIPQGLSAIVFEAEDPPMMVFKKNIANNRAALADALLTAWESSSLGQQAITIPLPSLKPCPLIPPPPLPSPPPPEKECPPGTIPDPSNDLCILPLPGTVKTECTDAEMNAEFQRQEDFCAGIRSTIDLACGLGTTPCEIGGTVGKFACDLWERLYGKPFPGTKSPACSEPRSQFYEKCIVSTIVGSKGNMPCYPGSGKDIRDKYRKWPGREK